MYVTTERKQFDTAVARSVPRPIKFALTKVLLSAWRYLSETIRSDLRRVSVRGN
jgi:hypothetical protein